MQKNILLYAAFLLIFLNSCSRKEVKQGKIIYSIDYLLPDSLRRYAEYLPKTATVFFKGDSAVSVQQMNDEATTIITHKPTDFMRVLLSSSTRKFMIDFKKAEQADELPAHMGYTYTATTETKTIAGHKAIKYNLTDKETGLSSEAWFSKELALVPNSLTMVFDTTYGVPLAFTTRQGDMVTRTAIKEVKLEPVPDGIFSTPAGYQKLTPKQLREMPLEN